MLSCKKNYVNHYQKNKITTPYFFLVPKAQPLTYTQLAFYLSDQTSTDVILDTIKVKTTPPSY